MDELQAMGLTAEVEYIPIDASKVPYCLTGETEEVTKENFGTDVQLYLHERRTD